MLFQADSPPEVDSWVQSLKEVCSAMTNPVQSQSGGDSQIQIYHEGNLLKEGNNLVKDWKRRWFVLKDDRLTYYKKKGV